MKQVFLSILILLLPLVANAFEFQVENDDGITIYYNYYNDGTELEVTYGYKSSNSYKGNVVIPEMVTYMGRTRKVTSIGTSAFQLCNDLTSVTIPNTVTNIGKRAFADSGNLSSIIIPNSVIIIGAEAFCYCYGLSSLIIGNCVEEIGRNAFYYCSLTSLTIPNSVRFIGESAFAYCGVGITSITIPENVTSIGYYAFDGIDYQTVISKIKDPFGIGGKDVKTFNQNTFNNATLYVPVGTIDKYKETKGWKDFLYIEEGAGPNGDGQKCAKPTISVVDGKLKFSCETDEVEYHYTISNDSPASGEGNDVAFSQKYTIMVYASKSGYENSDTATAEINATLGLNGDVNGDGVVNAADVVKVTNIIMGE